jgi:hypothetical protein
MKSPTIMSMPPAHPGLALIGGLCVAAGAVLIGMAVIAVVSDPADNWPRSALQVLAGLLLVAPALTVGPIFFASRRIVVTNERVVIESRLLGRQLRRQVYMVGHVVVHHEWWIDSDGDAGTIDSIVLEGKDGRYLVRSESSRGGSLQAAATPSILELADAISEATGAPTIVQNSSIRPPALRMGRGGA